MQNNTVEILALLNSNVAKYYFWVFNPSINLQVKDVKSFPIILTGEKDTIEMAETNLRICKTSWDYKKHPLVDNTTLQGLIIDKYEEWKVECDNRFF